MDDASLVRDAIAGSVPAFTEIFHRHEARVHDAALAMLRDRKAAVAAVHATFLEASERLETLEQPARLQVWLLALTRYHVALIAGSEAGPDRRPGGTRPARGSGADGQDGETERAHQVGLVWEATADLPLRERALIDLHLRQGLDGDDLADALGVSPAEATDLRAWMQATEDGLAGYLIMGSADGRCGDLPLLLRGWDGRFTSLVSGHIAAHVTSCRVCREERTALPSPFTLYAEAAQAPLPGPDVGSTRSAAADTATAEAPR